MNDEIKLPNLTKFLASCGVLSRRAAAEAVKSGRVTVNGAIVTEPGTPIATTDRVTLDSNPVSPQAEKKYILLNKPRGYVCTNQDIHAAKKAVDLINLNGKIRLFSAGRLDKDSEGAIIFSNDGDFVEFLSHPKFEIKKRYIVTLDRELSDGQRQRAQAGIEDEGEMLRVLKIESLGKCRYRITLNEGKKREIRRIVAALGATTKRLKRISIGSLPLGDLPVGKWRELTAAELAALWRKPERQPI